jgi:hypothetical protein
LGWSFFDFMEPRETVQARWLAVTGAAAGGSKERESGSEKEVEGACHIG